MKGFKENVTLIVFLIAFNVGCSTQAVKTPIQKASESPEKKSEEVVEVNSTSVVEVETRKIIVESSPMLVPPLTPPPQENIVYFGFDSTELSETSKDIINMHIAFLLKEPRYSVMLEGHTDIHGSDEYNQALGGLRAEAIKRTMISKNVNENQINLVSHGESKPAVIGNGATAWQANRRAVIIYREIVNTVNEESSKVGKIIVFDD